MISGYPTVVPRIRQARVAHGGGGGDSPPGSPVAVDLMEEVQLRNKAGRIQTSKPMAVPDPEGPGGATGTDMESPDIGTLMHTAM